MQIEYWNISSVKPYPNNPRQNATAVKAVANSIQEYGFQQPIVVDSNGTIIVGHTRLLAAKKLKMKKVPVTVASELSEEQTRAYRLADNKTGELSTWDFKKLALELDELNSFSVNMSEFGFKPQEKKIKENLIPETWQVVIECNDENDQKDLYTQLIEQGRKCKLLNL